MNSLRSTLNGFIRYRLEAGNLSFILHRLTGLGTLLFLSIHILDTSTVYFFPSLYSHAIDIYRSTPFVLLEIVLVFSVIYHGVNGARIAIFDLFTPASWRAGMQARSAIITLGVALALWLPAAYLMGRKLLIHNFGL
ncbi:MAG TPA: succinate dehydrogenase, cytochrome b556 subunit [Anaerolineales bacterium]|nr:succinate dehydrogenase, cytochrome b556 subunit [Anaerolineales bacterium]